MCGIVYSKNFYNRDSVATVLKRFEAQRHRGTTSFGYYLVSQDKMCHAVREGRIKHMLKTTEGNKSEILFHHRFSTSTPDVRNSCHPFSTHDNFECEYIGVHNGVISNSRELKTVHDGLGIEYTSLIDDGRFNDSEALVYDLARYLEGQVDSISAKGSAAFIIIKLKAGKPKTLFFGRNSGNPLMMKKTDSSLTISSTGEGESVEVNQLYSYDYETGVLRKRPMIIPTYTYNYTGRYNGTYYSEDKWWMKKTNTDYRQKTLALGEGDSKDKTSQLMIRKGSFKEVREQLLKEAQGDYETAAINVLTEIDEVGELVKKMEAVLDIMPDATTKAYGEAVITHKEMDDFLLLLQAVYYEFEDKLDDAIADDSPDDDTDDVDKIRDEVEGLLSSKEK